MRGAGALRRVFIRCTHGRVLSDGKQEVGARDALVMQIGTNIGHRSRARQVWKRS